MICGHIFYKFSVDSKVLPLNAEASKRQKSTDDGYQNVPFLYSTEEAFTAARTSEEAMGSSDFKPPFSVPENLLSHLVSTRALSRGITSATSNEILCHIHI